MVVSIKLGLTKENLLPPGLYLGCTDGTIYPLWICLCCYESRHHADTKGNHQLTTDIIKEYNKVFEEYPQMQLEGNEQYILKNVRK